VFYNFLFLKKLILHKGNYIIFPLKIILGILCIINTGYEVKAQCPMNPVNLFAQDSTNYTNKTSTYISNNAILPCNSQPIYIYADKNQFGGANMPCIATQYTIGFADGGFCSSASETFYEGGVDLLCIGPSAPCIYPIGGGSCSPGTWSINKIFLDPSQQHNFQFCDPSFVTISTSVELQDCWSGAALSPTKSFSLLSSSNPCFTDSVLANTDIGTASFTIAPASYSVALTDFHNGKSFIDPSLLAAGTYTVTYTFKPPAGDGCATVNGTFKFTVPATPTVTVSSDTICAGSSATLTASGATTYSWSNSATGTTITPSPTVTTTYTVTGTTGTCSSTKTTSVIVNPRPTITVNSATVCAGNTATLTASGANTYTWSTLATGSTITISPTVTTTYTVVGTALNGCTNTTTKAVTVNSLPNVTANATSTVVCSGGSVTLTGGGANTYTWNNGVNNGVSFTPVSTQTYVVTGTDGNGCTNSATKIITVSPSLTVTANATSTVVCSGGSVTLTGGGANTYSWNQGVTNGVPFTPSSTQTYVVTGTDGNGCTGTATIIVTVNSLPTVTANATSTVVCSGGSVTLTGGGANTYTWNNGVNNGVSFMPVSTQTYVVTGTDGNGCTNTATKIIKVNPLPSVTANATDSTLCPGESITLTGGGAVSYTWNHSVTDGISFTPASTQTYVVTGTDGNGCSNTATKIIRVNPLPSVTANATDSVLCQGDGVTLTGGGANTYTWSGGVTNGVAFTPSSTQTYTVTGTDGNGCTNTATKVITVNSLPTVTANATSTVVCAGTSITLTGGGAVTYTWSSGVINGVSFVPSTQTYTVTGTDANGCVNSATKFIAVNPLPIVTANATNSVVCAGNSTILTGGGASTYTWSGGVSNGVSFTPSSTQTYTVVGTDMNGCTNSATKLISVNSLPVISANATATLVCVGANITLTGSGANTYTWSGGISNGVAFTPTSTQTFTVTGTDANGCVNSATKLISVDLQPSSSNAGTAQNICATTTSLSANAPTTGTGAWSVVSGGGTVTIINSPTSAASNLGVGQNIFMWTITNGICPASTSTVSIRVDAPPTTASAGANQDLCAVATASLLANNLSVGTGVWSLVSGSGTIASDTSAGTAVSGLTTGQNIFMWTVTNGVCPSSTSTVSIQIDAMPTVANAGPDVLVYGPNTTLAANIPVIGYGVWSVVSGGGTFSSNLNPTAAISNLQFGENVFMWTISNGACPATKDEVVITLHELIIPNGFSPNGDGTNDNFEIPGLTQYGNVKLDVFNRWGNLVFHTDDYKNDWGGKNNSGEILTDDTYFYTLEITGRKTYKGFVVKKSTDD
jgi:gliding motility-associated-like protein